MKRISILVVHVIGLGLFIWNSMRLFIQHEDVIGLYVNLIAALLTVISGLIYFMMTKKKQSKHTEASQKKTS